MKILNILIIIIVFSCGGGSPTESELAEEASGNDSRPRISMDMSDDYKLTIGINNIEETVTSMSFEVIFDDKALNYSNYSAVDFGQPLLANADHMDVNNDSTHCSFAFMANISGSGDLIKIDFQQNNQSDLRGTTIFFRNLEIFNGDNIIEFVDPELVVERICYIDGFESIDEGSLIWTDYGEYTWSNHYCSIGYEVLP